MLGRERGEGGLKNTDYFVGSEPSLLISTAYFPLPLQKTGQSSLHAAAASGSVGCVQHILEVGADSDSVDNENVHAAHR